MVKRPGSCGPILVADGSASVRVETAALLGRSGFQVIETESGERAVELARSVRPAVVLLEVRLPGISGYEACRELRDEFGTSLAVVLVSGERTESFDRVAGLLVGADEYLARPVAPDELIATVRGLASRSLDRHERGSAGGTGDLTRRELEVLELLAAGLEGTEIADRLVISPKTVDGHIERILAKLNVHSRAQAVGLAYREGLVRE